MNFTYTAKQVTLIVFLNNRHGKQMSLRFLVGIFEEKARLLQWLLLFRQFNAIGPLFVQLFNFLAEFLTRILVRI